MRSLLYALTVLSLPMRGAWIEIDVETEMAKANAIGDTDYFNDLKTERETLVNEYTTKRGEI